jgi:hypothetical protein
VLERGVGDGPALAALADDLASGTRTSVKKTSLNSAWPVMVFRGRTSMPGVFMEKSR